MKSKIVPHWFMDELCIYTFHEEFENKESIFNDTIAVLGLN